MQSRKGSCGSVVNESVAIVGRVVSVPHAIDRV